jgi:uncharacterized protein YqeY
LAGEKINKKGFKMVTIPEIRKEILNAKREGNKEKSLILTTFLENAQKIAKEDKNREMTDQDLVAGVKREIKMAEQSKAAGAPYSELVFQLGASFLPKQMTERELRVTIEAIVSDLDKPNMGAIMKELKTFGDSVDMKAANVIIKEILG